MIAAVFYPARNKPLNVVMKKYIFVGLASLALCSLVLLFNRVDKNEDTQIPTPGEISQIEYLPSDDSTETILVDASKHADLISAIRSAQNRIDSNPMKWQIDGMFVITTHDGSTVDVHLYNTGREYNALRIGNKYYRFKTRNSEILKLVQIAG